MGCVVNGIGEMKNADIGMVGKKRDRVDLYFKNEKIEKDLKVKEAEKILLKILKKNFKIF